MKTRTLAIPCLVLLLACCFHVARSGTHKDEQPAAKTSVLRRGSDVPARRSTPDLLASPAHKTANAAEMGNADNDSPANSFVSDEIVSRERWQFGTLWGRETEPALAAFSAWAQRYVETESNEARGRLVGEGERFALKRREVLKDMIAIDPHRALAAAVPLKIRQRLPREVARNLEERVSGEGDLEVLAAIPAPAQRSAFRSIVRQAVIGNRTFEVYVRGLRGNLKTTKNLSMHGIAVDRTMALSASPLRLLESGEAPAPGKPLEDTRCPISRRQTMAAGWIVETGTRTYRMCSATHIADLDTVLATAERNNAPVPAYESRGAKRVLVMLVDFSDKPGGPVDQADATQKMHQVDAFFRANSF
ncbi:MAG: hypothetical protein L0Z50_29270, partial [Verrucomicrobiales bacterium]|nr:hypothetical protein [Verrucomicrobiales bacterium]